MILKGPVIFDLTESIIQMMSDGVQQNSLDQNKTVYQSIIQDTAPIADRSNWSSHLDISRHCAQANDRAVVVAN